MVKKKEKDITDFNFFSSIQNHLSGLKDELNVQAMLKYTVSILSSQMPNISAIVITKILTLEHRAPGTYIMRHTKESAANLQI